MVKRERQIISLLFIWFSKDCNSQQVSHLDGWNGKMLASITLLNPMTLVWVDNWSAGNSAAVYVHSHPMQLGKISDMRPLEFVSVRVNGRCQTTPAPRLSLILSFHTEKHSCVKRYILAMFNPDYQLMCALYRSFYKLVSSRKLDMPFSDCLIPRQQVLTPSVLYYLHWLPQFGYLDSPFGGIWFFFF